MDTTNRPVSVVAAAAPLRAKPSAPPFPPLMVAKVAGREKRPLGDLFGLTNFGVNLTRLKPGMCAGFKAGTGDAHHFVNRTNADVVFLEVGDRSAGDSVSYPDDDVVAVFGPDGKWRYTRKDGTPY